MYDSEFLERRICDLRRVQGIYAEDYMGASALITTFIVDMPVNSPVDGAESLEALCLRYSTRSSNFLFSPSDGSGL